MKKSIVFLAFIATAFSGCQESANEIAPSAALSSAKVTAYVFDFPATNANKFASYVSGNYGAYNDIWSSSAVAQRFAGSSATSFDCLNSNQPFNPQYQVKAYPHSTRNVNKKVSALGSCTSSVNVTVPATSGNIFNAAYDVWLGSSDKYEIMIWMYNYGAGPLKDDYNAPAPYANISVGGHTWNLWRKYWSATGKYVYSFVRTSNTTSGTVDVKALLNYLRNTAKYNGTPWMGDENLNRVEFGFEISQSTNSTFKLNSYSVNYN